MRNLKTHFTAVALVLLIGELSSPRFVCANDCCSTGTGCMSGPPFPGFQASCQNIPNGVYHANSFCQNLICVPKPGGDKPICEGSFSGNDCSRLTGIPTVSGWGLFVLGLLTASAATIVIMRQRARLTD